MSKDKKYNHTLRSPLDCCGFTKEQENIMLGICDEIVKMAEKAKTASEFTELFEIYLTTTKHIIKHPREFAYALTELMIKTHECPVCAKQANNMKMVQVTPEKLSELLEILANKKKEDIN